MMSQAGLARARPAASAYEACGTHRVVGRSKGSGDIDDVALIGTEQSSDRVDCQHLQCFQFIEGREDGRQSSRKHCLARAGWSLHEQIVGAGSRDLEGSNGHFLTHYLAEFEVLGLRGGARCIGRSL